MKPIKTKSKKPVLKFVYTNEQLNSLVASTFEDGDDFYSNKDILHYFNSLREHPTTMRVLGRALSAFGFSKNVVKHEGKAVRGFYLKPIKK